MDPKDFMRWHQLSCVNHKLGRHEDAMACVRSALKHRVEYKPAQQQLAVLLAEAATRAAAVTTAPGATGATDALRDVMRSEEEDDEDDGILADECFDEEGRCEMISSETAGGVANDGRQMDGKHEVTVGFGSSDFVTSPAGPFDYRSWVKLMIV